MQIDWTLLTYLIVGIFVLSGFSSGWWKEAIIAFFLGALVFLLQNPTLAQAAIDIINSLLALVPDSLVNFFENALGVTLNLQIDASASGTWLMILLLGVLMTTQIGRSGLPNYALTPIGRLLGALLGGVNGFIILNLVREYLDGRSLPGGSETAGAAGAGMTLAGESSFGPAASTLSIQATNLPHFTILDSVVPWIIIGAGFLIFLAALTGSYFIESNKENMKKIARRTPFGYKPAPKPGKPSREDALRTLFGG
ncbi:MAG: hypothetical protein AB1801_01220 [Chloroflexota bacterium]